MKMSPKSTKRDSTLPKTPKRRVILWVILFGAIGLLTLIITKAATPFVTLEPELGTLAGSVTQTPNDPLTSGGFVQFGTATPGTPSNPGPWSNITGSIKISSYGTTQIVAARSNPKTVYVGTCEEGIWKSTNSGTSWTHVSATAAINSGCNNFVGVDPTNENIVYTTALHSSQGFWKSIDGGVNWTQKLPASLTDIFGVQDTYNISFNPSDPSHIIVGGHQTWGSPYSGSGILESKDKGETWRAINPNLGWATSSNALFIDATTWLYVNGDGPTYRTTNAGATWAQVGTAGCQGNHGGSNVYKASNGSLYLALLNCIVRSTDNGATWSDFTPAGSCCQNGFYWVQGDGTYIYVQGGPAWDVGAAPFYYIPETATNKSSWTTFNNNQKFTTGPFSMSIDPVNRIFYSANWIGGVWKFNY